MVLQSWEGSRHTEMEAVRCKSRTQGVHHNLVVLLESLKLQAAIHSRGDP